MECIIISHDDKDEKKLIDYIKNILDQRYALRCLTYYEIRKVKEIEKIKDD